MAELTVRVKVTPRADRDAVVGWQSQENDELLVRVSAAPDDGKANQALIKTLSQSLGIPKSSITITRGYTSRQKLLALQMDSAQFKEWKRKLPTKK